MLANIMIAVSRTMDVWVLLRIMFTQPLGNFIPQSPLISADHQDKNGQLKNLQRTKKEYSALNSRALEARNTMLPIKSMFDKGKRWGSASE